MSSISFTPRSLWHLVARFVTSLAPTPPALADELWVDEQLTSSERSLWVQMSNQDRRHSIAVARRFVGARHNATRAEIAGALLHDVGKIDCHLGAFGRVVATVVGARWSDRFRSYHDHERIGAAFAAAAGSDSTTVELIAGDGPAHGALKASDHA